MLVVAYLWCCVFVFEGGQGKVQAGGAGSCCEGCDPGALLPLPGPQLRISSIIRRDSEPENPSYPGAPAQPATKVGAVLAELAGGQRRDEVIHLSFEDLEGVAA
jgi:hypothetical protein